jgi:hypothetical protein
MPLKTSDVINANAFESLVVEEALRSAGGNR